MSFEKFWESYPRKVGKGAALRAWERLEKKELSKYLPCDEADIREKIIESVAEHMKTRQWQDKQFIPHPSTYLNQRRWEDELTPADFLPKQRPPTRKEAYREGFTRAAEAAESQASPPAVTREDGGLLPK